MNDNDEHLGPDGSDRPPSVMAATATPTIDGKHRTTPRVNTTGGRQSERLEGGGGLLKSIFYVFGWARKEDDILVNCFKLV